MNETVDLCLLDAGCQVLLHNSQQSQVNRFRCAFRACGVLVRGIAFALSLGRDVP